VYTVLSPQVLTDSEVIITEETPAEIEGAEIEEVDEEDNMNDLLG
ncbi:hypothetical protein LCGC14_2739670, partial [marine sediment metagenome]